MQRTFSMGSRTAEEKNRFPGVVSYVETFDTDDDSESANILSFESLREAFTTVHASETALAKTIPEIAPSAEKPAEPPEAPDYGEPAAPADSEADLPMPAHQAERAAEINVRLEIVIEAILFIGNRENRPFLAEQMAEHLRNVSPEEVEQTVVHLNGAYDERQAPYTIIAESGGYRMVLRSEFEPIRSNFYGKLREIKLSRQAIDTLAVVAYRQPITAEEIQKIRNQSCAAVLNQLVRRNLLLIRRKEPQRDESQKRSVAYYHTAPRLLELLRIKSLDDLPQSEELEYR